MNEWQFFTALTPGWFNAWIPVWGMVLIQFVFMFLYREGGKRAVDTSWYTAKDRRNALWSTFFQITLLLVSVFVPFKTGTTWFAVGCVLFALSLMAFIAAFYAYGAALPDEAVTGGIYRYSRNPMYFAFHLGMLAVCIASTSLWLLIVIVPFFVFTHLTILGEERYCEATYGETYRAYKAKTPRYFLIG